MFVEALFPQCKVSRADRLERRIIYFDHQLDSIAFKEQGDYLRKEWIPQATQQVYYTIINVCTCKYTALVVLVYVLISCSDYTTNISTGKQLPTGVHMLQMRWLDMVYSKMT